MKKLVVFSLVAVALVVGGAELIQVASDPDWVRPTSTGNLV
ncbi:hypothetical protein [Alteribacter populi]|nr:hypothetical protein [Alteribacter populi]